MATESIRGVTTPSRDQVFGQSVPEAQIHPFLTIQPPTGPDDKPPVLSFRRKRRVELPWNEILGSRAITGETSIAPIREYFELS